MEMSNLSPGLLLEMLNSKDYLESKNAQHGKSHRSEAHYNEDCAWIANITNPKQSTFQLAMMMNLAWNKNALKAGCKTYIQNTLNAFFGAITGKKIMPLMEEYYRLPASDIPLIWRCLTAILSFIQANSATNWSVFSTATTC